MATIGYTDLTTLVNDTTIAAATAENIIDQAKNELNAYGLGLAASTGAAGSKAWSCTDGQKAAILAVALEYYQYYKTSGANATSFAAGSLSHSTSTSTGGSAGRIHEVAKNLAQQLLGRSFLRT